MRTIGSGCSSTGMSRAGRSSSRTPRSPRSFKKPGTKVGPRRQRSAASTTPWPPPGGRGPRAYFTRLEADADFGDLPWHGDDGLLPITRYLDVELTEVAAAGLEALKAGGFPTVEDHNRTGAVGAGRLPMSSHDGIRVTTADAFLPGSVGVNLGRRLDAVHERCLAERLEVTYPATDEPWGVREMHVRPPRRPRLPHRRSASRDRLTQAPGRP